MIGTEREICTHLHTRTDGHILTAPTDTAFMRLKTSEGMEVDGVLLSFSHYTVHQCDEATFERYKKGQTVAVAMG